MTTANIDPLVVGLQRHLADLGDGRNARSDNERATYQTAYQVTEQLIGGLQNAPAALKKPTRLLADAEANLAAHKKEQAEIEQALATAPDPLTTRDARERDAERERQRQLQLRLDRLREGTLLVAPGVQLPSMAYLEQRIAELTERRDRAQRALDGCIAGAEQLLATVPVTT